MSIKDRRNAVLKSSISLNSIRDSVTSFGKGISQSISKANEIVKQTRKTKSTESHYVLASFILNPLLLIETVGNIHNDVVMMLLALLAVYLLLKNWNSKQKHLWTVIALLIFSLSVSTKLASSNITIELI